MLSRRLPALYDEPFADSSQIPTFLIAQLAREQVTVSLSGDGGDECFGGYNRYLWKTRITHLLNFLPHTVRAGVAHLLTALPPAAWDRAFAALAFSMPKRLGYSNPGDKLHKLAEILAANTHKTCIISTWFPSGSIPWLSCLAVMSRLPC